VEKSGRKIFREMVSRFQLPGNRNNSHFIEGVNLKNPKISSSGAPKEKFPTFKNTHVPSITNSSLKSRTKPSAFFSTRTYRTLSTTKDNTLFLLSSISRSLTHL